ncbi:MAG TPA: MFS transporter [Candidatus Limnocylindrales bacterium]|nr:MFS transporter [Candidatus Limnocylindrales bacterium]
MSVAPVPRGLQPATLVALFVAALALRPQLLAIGPLLPLIRADLGLPAGVAGLLTTIPVLCMGLFAPFGARLAARVGPRAGLAICLGLIGGGGLLRAAAPDIALLLLATFGIGVGIGLAGAIPAIVVAQRLPHAPVHGTSAYAAGIVAGSAGAAAIAVPLAIDGDWRVSLAIISAAVLASIGIWLVVLRADASARRLEARAPRLPWRSGTGWLLVALFGVQSILYYGIVSWMPNALVERGWSAADAGALIAIFNGIGLVTTIGVPLVAARLGSRRRQLLTSAITGVIGITGFVFLPDLALFWIVLLGPALGAVFPLLLTLPVDIADDPGHAGSIAALMLLGGYALASLGPVVLGVARDLTGNFGASLWLLVATAVLLVGLSTLLSPARLRRGVRRPPIATI